MIHTRPSWLTADLKPQLWDSEDYFRAMLTYGMTAVEQENAFEIIHEEQGQQTFLSLCMDVCAYMCVSC